MATFSHGVHPKGNKELTSKIPIERLDKSFFEKFEVFIPLAQFANEPVNVLVQAGQHVKKGELIATFTGKFGVNVHASISGTVQGIVKRITLNGQKADHIHIVWDETIDEVFMEPLTELTSQSVRDRIRDAGIIGMGGAGFPTHFKMTVPEGKKVDTLLMNAAECEPYINCDNRLMVEEPLRVIDGAKVMMVACGASRAVIAMEDNKPAAFEAISAALKNDPDKTVSVVKLKTKYPQGAEKMLVKAALKRTVPAGGLPVDVGVGVVNVHSAYCASYAVRDGRVVSDRVVTVSGRGVYIPKNLLVPIGVKYSDLLTYCGGKIGDVREIISGGPMMGSAQTSTDIAVAKATSAVLFMHKEEICEDETTTCINCGKCASVCPMRLMPMYIDSCALLEQYDRAKKYGAMDCMECGSCSFICPAKRPLMQSIKVAKKLIRQRKI